MDIAAAIQVIREFGFPVLVATYVLMRIEPVLRQIAVTQAAQLELLRLVTETILHIKAPMGGRS